MVKCFFCGKEESPHKGIHLIRNTGVVLFFCSSKCRKNTLELKRDKRKIRWTEAYAESKAKSLAKHAKIKAVEKEAE